MKRTAQGPRNRISVALVLATLLGGPVSGSAAAQEVRVVEVDGREVRVRTAGLASGPIEPPVVVFEAGFMYDGLQVTA